jgi:NSS family neurotransmitter:Na+ symporter
VTVDVRSGDGSPTWSSRLAFFFAAVGAAVGLGNVWKFPYSAGEYGGGAFVLVYLAAAMAVAVPIVIAELLIGRRGRGSPIHAVGKLAEQAGASRAWQAVAWVNVIAGFLILTFYSVIAGWALAYVPKFATGLFASADAALADQEFAGMLASPLEMTVWHALFMALTAVVVAGGVERGIERAVSILMPSLFVMLMILVGYAAVAGDFAAALDFLFAVDFSKLKTGGILSAIGQAFFSVSVAMGIMIAYGAYLPKDVRLPRSAVYVALADTGVAILAGLAIFPLVFANGLDAASGPGLLFVTLPIAFGQMPAGMLFGTVFFVLIAFAALTSSIALLEPLVAWTAERTGLGRRVVVSALGLLAWIIGLASVLSFNLWADFHPFGNLPLLGGKSVFDALDYLTQNIMLPLGGILIAVFVGWIMQRTATADEIGEASSSLVYRVWHLLVRFVAPLAIGVVLIYTIIVS